MVRIYATDIPESKRDLFYEQLAIHYLISECDLPLPILKIKAIHISNIAYNIELESLPDFIFPPKIEDTVRSLFQMLFSIIEISNKIGIIPKIAVKRLFISSKDQSLVLNAFDYDCYKSPSSGKYIDHPVYIEPENLEPKGFYSQTNSWQLGVLLYRLLTKELPFGDQILQSCDRMLRFDYNTDPLMMYSEECRDLIAAIFTKEEDRITMEGIKNHPWFAKGYVNFINQVQIDREQIEITKAFLKRRIATAGEEFKTITI